MATPLWIRRMLELRGIPFEEQHHREAYTAQAGTHGLAPCSSSRSATSSNAWATSGFSMASSVFKATPEGL